MDELKKCPFCGGKAGIFYSFDTATEVEVVCCKCGARTQGRVVRGQMLKESLDLIVARTTAAWNGRVREDD